MELSQVGNDARQQLSQEVEETSELAAVIFGVFGLTHACRGNTLLLLAETRDDLGVTRHSDHTRLSLDETAPPWLPVAD